MLMMTINAITGLDVDSLTEEEKKSRLKLWRADILKKRGRSYYLKYWSLMPQMKRPGVFYPPQNPVSAEGTWMIVEQ
ncbi:hypothetical protein [Paenibacillus luteus]|uniref:hypothetical protein n=1 Tax=Paenibacillus luteus TaxID=2545753 RepID=UPI0019D66B12|nr:hypothetical protein [Paenibacillus luteus]